MFWQTEGRRIRNVVLTVLGVYAAGLLVMLGCAYVVHLGAESYLSWLSPWPINFTLLAAAVLVIWLCVIAWSYSKKKPCHHCKVMTRYVAADGTPTCIARYIKIAEEHRYNDARKRAVAEPPYPCPKCSAGGTVVKMIKHFAEAEVGTAIVVVDVCDDGCGGEFRDAGESELLKNAAYEDGRRNGRSAVSLAHATGYSSGIIIGSVIN